MSVLQMRVSALGPGQWVSGNNVRSWKQSWVRVMVPPSHVAVHSENAVHSVQDTGIGRIQTLSPNRRIVKIA